MATAQKQNWALAALDCTPWRVRIATPAALGVDQWPVILAHLLQSARYTQNT